MIPRWLGALLLALLLAAGGWAQDTVPELSGRVIDQTGTLTSVQREALDARLAALESERGAQVVILIVASTQPEDIAAYAQRVADSWKIGRKEIGDGVLIVVAKDDRKVRIEVAKTLEGAVPDLAASRIIREAITPAFKAGDFGGGLSAAVDRIAARIANEGLPEPDAANEAADRGGAGFDWHDLAIFLFVGAPILGAVLTGIFGRKVGALATGGVVGGIGWWITASLLVAGGAALLALALVGVLDIGSRGGGGSGGRGPGGPIIWGRGGGGGWGGGGRGGGFRSGGGGDFGGGGASGSW